MQLISLSENMKTPTKKTVNSSPHKNRSESVIIYANGKDDESMPISIRRDHSNYVINGESDLKNGTSSRVPDFHSPLDSKKFTIIAQTPSSPSPPSIYYFDSGALTSCGVVLTGGWNSERPLDSSESSINLYDVGSTIQLSPVSENECQENRGSTPSCSRNKLKRGRPKLETISNLIETNAEILGSTIKCDVCKRTFPREKSLQAHLRIHTGERPYVCDFPDCGRKFAQSGQLRTHQRLHTGEKPFVCNFEGCENRFTHANRRCPLHPMVGVSRDKDIGSPVSILKSNSSLNNTSQEILDWLQGYYRSIKRQGLKRSKESSCRPFKARKLDMDLDVTESNNSCQENSDLIWKKKRAALQLQAKRENHLIHQDNGSDAGTITDNSSPVKRPNIHEEVKSNYEQFSSDRLMGALALMELANCPVMNVNNSFGSESYSDSTFNCTDLTDVSETHDYHKEMDDLILENSLGLIK